MAVSLIYLVIIYMEWDRVLSLKFWSYESFAEDYTSKPAAHPTRRVVILYVDPNESAAIPSDMFKSILDQSVKVTDIAIQTATPKKFKSMKSFTSTHVPGTELISEGDASTILIPVEPRIYPYDFVERMVSTRVENSPFEGEEGEEGARRDPGALQSAFRRIIVS